MSNEAICKTCPAPSPLDKELDRSMSMYDMCLCVLRKHCPVQLVLAEGASDEVGPTAP